MSGEDLLLTLDLMARLDLDIAKARYSAAIDAVVPWVADQEVAERSLKLVRARHPLLTGAVVPVSIDLDREQQVMLITGPNAGGKTVTLKTVGLLAMMAQAGLHVPAEEAHLPRFDGVYADIGDLQSIQQSLSTFSSHITNVKGIMSRATVHSLVLIDELGTSTDPEEGSALASAVLRYFQKIGSFVVGTTHHRGVARFVQDELGIPTIPDNWRNTRSTSLPSASRASRQRLPTSIAGMGSTKTVAPLSGGPAGRGQGG
jgi:DNA mismatch repair protein MutS2